MTEPIVMNLIDSDLSGPNLRQLVGFKELVAQSSQKVYVLGSEKFIPVLAYLSPA